MTNVVPGDLAYAVDGQDLTKMFEGITVTVIAYECHRNYPDHGYQPDWICTSGSTIFSCDGRLIPAGKEFIVPDFCLRKISGPSVETDTTTETPVRKEEHETVQ